MQTGDLGSHAQMMGLDTGQRSQGSCVPSTGKHIIVDLFFLDKRVTS